MITLKNNGKGPRAVLMLGGGYTFLQPGEQKSINGSKVRSIPSDVVELALEASDAGSIPEQPAGLANQATGFEKFDHNGDGLPGGSKPHYPPALSEMTRAELEHQLQAEGLDLDHITGTGRNGAVVMADIRNAIEAHRAKADQG
jgi:hypothetical protein